MLLLINLFFVFLISFAVGAMFSIGLRGRHDWAGTFWLFVILFFGTWALGAWLRPFGPPAWDVLWVPYVVAAAVIALLLAAVTPTRIPPRARADGTVPPVEPEAIQTRRRAAEAVTALSVFYWLLLGVSLLAIALHYVSGPSA